MGVDHLGKISIYFLGEREELDRIEAVFTWLKINLGINKTELYKKALLWIAEGEKSEETKIYKNNVLKEKDKNPNDRN